MSFHFPVQLNVRWVGALSVVLITMKIVKSGSSSPTNSFPHIDWSGGQEEEQHACSTILKLPNAFHYARDDLENISLYSKQYRLPSFVEYPCSTSLYGEYKTKFFDKLLTCPFEKNLDIEFNEFKKMLNKTDYNDGQMKRNGTENTLVLQYICFSNQLEECVFDEGRSKRPGFCDGVCRCRKNIALNANQYPLGYTEKERNELQPIIVTEGLVRCGVRVGKLCIPRWTPGCPKNPELERKYKPEDFYLQCEANAGCHPEFRVCQCAMGHQCSVGESRWRVVRKTHSMWLFSLLELSSYLLSYFQ